MSCHGYEGGRLNLPFVGVDLTEVAPDYDYSGITAILAAQLLMNLIGRIMNQRNHARWLGTVLIAISKGNGFWLPAQAEASAPLLQ
jgi:hypothetical protein